MKKLCILIIDDHALFRTGMSMILNQHDDISKTLEAGSIMAALDIKDEMIDLILLDIQLPGLNGLQGINILLEKFSATPVIILSASHDRAEIHKASEQGAMGFLPKSANADEIMDAIDTVLKGGRCFPEDTDSIHEPSIKAESTQLTTRQLQVLSLLCEGKPNKIIARELDMAENTVRVHVSAILNNLGVSSRTEAMLAAQRQGIIGAPK